MLILLWILLILGAVSIFLAYSEFPQRHTSLGWAFIGIYLAVYLTFVIRLLAGLRFGPEQGSLGGIIGGIGAIALFVFLLGIQGPLALQLITHSVMPDPSRGLKVIKVYTEAERKAAQDDLPGAIAEYEKVIEEEPDDVVARFRLAELCCENEEYRKAAMAYEAILARSNKLDVSQYCSAQTRLSEIHARHLGDPEAARRHVQAIIDKYPNTRYARYATDRLENLS